MSKADKAARLLAEGRVIPYRLQPGGGGIRARVRGESGYYDAAVWYDAKGRIRRHCTCEYAEIHPVTCACSHTLALEWLIEPRKETT